MNHVMGLTLTFLQKEEDICFNYILHFNLLYRFIQGIEFQQAQLFILTLLQFDEKKLLKQKNAQTMYKYCKYSEFFLDLAKLILNGEESLDQSKTDQRYKPGRVKELIKLTSEATLPEVETAAFAPIKRDKAAILPEDDHNFEADIDLCKALLLKSKQRKTRKKIPTKPSLSRKDVNLQDTSQEIQALQHPTVPSQTKLEKMKKYPSLREKWNLIEQQVGGKESTSRTSLEEENKKQSSSVDTRSPSKKTSNFNFDRTRSTVRGTQILAGQNSTAAVLASNDGKESPPRARNQTMKFSNTIARQPVTAQASNQNNTSMPIRDSSHSEISFDTSKQNISLSKDGINQKQVLKANIYGSIKANPFTLDESLECSALSTLSTLYPLSTRAYFQSDLDKESKHPNFQPNYVKIHDNFSLLIAEMVHIMIRKAFESEQHVDLIQKLNRPLIDYSMFWQAVFEPQNCKFFELLFKVFFLKMIKVMTNSRDLFRITCLKSEFII